MIRYLFVCALLLYPPLSGSALAVTEVTDNDYRQVEIITDVLSLIRDSYVEETDMTELAQGAVRGMLQTLDPHSSFLTPQMYQEMQEDTQGEFGGLGIEITIKDKQLLVVTPIEDTPAERAGVRAGDQIIKIDDQPTSNLEIMEAVRLLRGPQGEAVTISVRRSGQDEPLSFTIVRDIIQLQSVKSRLLESAYGYVRIAQFQGHTGEDLQQQLADLQQQPEQGLAGLILDLRNNPGGLLDQAVTVADLFLRRGLIVYTEGRIAGAQLKFEAQDDGIEPTYPLIVLVNSGSASAAEIVAGALQDHGRAIILGERTFGKGSVQTIIPLSNESGLRLTTARYYTPAGRSIQARGISPDIPVPGAVVSAPKSANQLRERDLANHFQAEGEASDREQQDNPAADDYQLQRALELLKGYQLLSSAKVND